MTAVIGKWHLGLGEGKEKLDWNAEIEPGPLDTGFRLLVHHGRHGRPRSYCLR